VLCKHSRRPKLLQRALASLGPEGQDVTEYIERFAVSDSTNSIKSSIPGVAAARVASRSAPAAQTRARTATTWRWQGCSLAIVPKPPIMSEQRGSKRRALLRKPSKVNTLCAFLLSFASGLLRPISRLAHRFRVPAIRPKPERRCLLHGMLQSHA